jgi:3-dehydroquinate dehydratase/shikimate dehydrogenase
MGMAHLAVAVMVESMEGALSAAARAAEVGADLIEYRLDHLPLPPKDVTLLVQRSALPSIVTCRPVGEGGQCTQGDAARLEVFRGAMAGARPATYIDVELAAWQAGGVLAQGLRPLLEPGLAKGDGTGLILSAHDFSRRPADLCRKIAAMTQEPLCRVVKVAWQARSLRDNVEAFEILQQRTKPTIALCMGEAGLPSRVLAGKFGGLLTYAALEDGAGTAPGQPTVAELKRLYRWDRIGPQTRVYGVIGYPVAHSMSPAIHNAGFEAVGFDGVYLPMPIAPQYEPFKATVSTWLELKGLDFRGASVTIPHKENLLRFVREKGGQVEPLAGQIGAANTLTVRDDSSLYASNTVYAAALDAVCATLDITRVQLADRRVAVIGAGGVARAIVAGFAHHGAEVVVYNRTFDRAQRLAADLAAAGEVSAAPLDELVRSRCQVYINCTSLGMHPNVEGSPVVEALGCWGAETVVFDTVYNPTRTKLLRQAGAAGCKTIAGTEMFTRQAAGQFELWTGKAVPLQVFQRVVVNRPGT